jgi:asparagine synthase (glutamine-hydrolysing)
MLDSVAAWYPDGTALQIAPRACLGIGRLITTAQQAFGDHGAKDSRVVAVVDGRLDDMDALRRTLGAAAHASDADLIVTGYDRWGPDVVARLRGEFALMIWDEGASTLVAARDPFGIRPLCYARSGGRLILASDPEQILAAGLAAAHADDNAVLAHLLWEFKSAEHTFFRDVRRLPAGHLLIANSTEVRIRDYRRPECVEVGDDRSVWEEFRRRFFTAVRRRMATTGSCVLHLSGGLDSSCIVCAADRIRTSDPAINLGTAAAAALYPGMESNEERFIRAVAAEVSLPVECWDGTAAKSDELTDVPIWAPGASFSWTGGTAGDLEIARRHGARVLVNGTGGDQLGIASGVLQDAIRAHRWGTVSRYLVDAPGATVASSIRAALKVAKWMAPPWVRHFHDTFEWRRQRKPAWLVPEAWAWRPKGAAPFRPPAAMESNVQRAHWLALTSPRHLLSMELLQQHAMRSGMEVRFPFMDWDLATFVLSVPAHLWPPPWPFERLHRTALGPILPKAILQRRSKANAWDALANRVRRQLPAIHDLFHGSSWAAARYVDQTEARRLLGTFRDEREGSFWTAWSVWAIATLEAWLRRVSDYTASPRREA